MDRINYFLIIIILVSNICFSQDQDSNELGADFFDPIIIKIFPIGEGNGELGFKPNSPYISRPSGFNFGPGGKFYITDPINNRIVKFSENFEYENDILCGPIDSWIRILEDGILVINGFSITKFNFNGDLIFDIVTSQIEYNGQRISEMIYDVESFVVLGNDVAIYLRSGEVLVVENPSSNIYDNEKNILSPVKSLNLLKQIAPSRSMVLGNSELGDGARQMPNSESNIDPMLYQNGKPIIHVPEIYFDMYPKDKSNSFQNFSTSESGGITSATSKESIIIEDYESFLQELRYLDEDSEGFTYWHKSPSYIAVFNTDNILHSFFYFNIERKGQIAVSPAGDIYMMSSNLDGHTLYQIPKESNW